MKNQMMKFTALAILLLGSTFTAYALEVTKLEISNILEIQQYNRAIHIMAMLLIGFGFLMVFIKKYGRSALTATFLLVSIALPFYIFIHSSGIMGESRGEIEELILAEFAAASLLIAAGAVLGRLCRYSNRKWSKCFKPVIRNTYHHRFIIDFWLFYRKTYLFFRPS